MFSKEELLSFREDFNATHSSLENEKLENLSRKEFFSWLELKKEELKGQISSSVTLSAKGQKERIDIFLINLIQKLNKAYAQCTDLIKEHEGYLTKIHS